MTKIIVSDDIIFYRSSAKSIKSFIGDLGVETSDDYILLEGHYSISTDLENLLKFTSKHQIRVEIVNGLIYLK